MSNPPSGLLEYVLGQLRGLGTLRHRKMFGGVYIYCDDRFIATIHDGTLYFKANVNTAPEFVARNLPIFSYLRNGEIATLQYYQAPEEVFRSHEQMELWARKAIVAAEQDANKNARNGKGRPPST